MHSRDETELHTAPQTSPRKQTFGEKLGVGQALQMSAVPWCVDMDPAGAPPGRWKLRRDANCAQLKLRDSTLEARCALLRPPPKRKRSASGRPTAARPPPKASPPGGTELPTRICARGGAARIRSATRQGGATGGRVTETTQVWLGKERRGLFPTCQRSLRTATAPRMCSPRSKANIR